MNLTQSLLSCSVVALASAHVQATTLVDRKFHQLAIVPVADGTPNHYDIHVIWTVEMNGTAAGLNANTGILLFLNGSTEVPIASLGVPVLIDVSTGLCGFPNCGAGCGGGFIDGVFNTMLCLHEPPTCESCGCGCQFPWITSTLPDVELQPGDELLVEIFGLPGAFPEEPSANNTAVHEFDGPVFWNRRLVSTTLKPGDQAGHIDLISVSQFMAVGLDIPSALSWTISPVIEGQDYGDFSLCGDDPWIISPDNPCSDGGPCPDSQFCASSSCGATNVVHECEAFSAGEPGFPLPGCGCLSEPVMMSILDVPGGPGDQITLILKPAAGGLPELPGFEDDDEVSPNLCPADLTGDAIVGAADLGQLLAEWGPCAACPSDIAPPGGDGTVGPADLAAMLAGWGQCFPV
jgi:hypothetical protein